MFLLKKITTIIKHTDTKEISSIQLVQEKGKYYLRTKENNPVILELSPYSGKSEDALYSYGLKPIIDFITNLPTGDYQLGINLESSSDAEACMIEECFGILQSKTKKALASFLYGEDEEKVSLVPISKQSYLRDNNGEILKFSGKPVVDETKPSCLNVKCKSRTTNGYKHTPGEKPKPDQKHVVTVFKDKSGIISKSEVERGFKGIYYLELDNVYQYSGKWYIGLKLHTCIVVEKKDSLVLGVEWL